MVTCRLHLGRKRSLRKRYNVGVVVPVTVLELLVVEVEFVMYYPVRKERGKGNCS